MQIKRIRRRRRLAPRIDPWAIDMERQELAVKAARRRARMMRWVEQQMRQRLTRRERVCLRLHYLEALSFAEIAQRTRTQRSAVSHAVRRSLNKLRAAASEDTSWRA